MHEAQTQQRLEGRDALLDDVGEEPGDKLQELRRQHRYRRRAAELRDAVNEV